jgi:septal ring factor EnvC (AmiA/AmiB activator)
LRAASPTAMSRRAVPTLIAPCVLVTAFFCVCVYAQPDPEERREVELESLRSQIRDVQSRISVARQDVDTYLSELQQSEQAATELSASLLALAETIKEKLVTLEQLQRESAEQQIILASERKLLAEQLRISYKTGHHDFLKLFLNQEDPALIGRMMTYHDYYNKARSNRITEIRMTLQNLSLLQTRIDQQTTELQGLRDEQIHKLQQLDTYRNSRSSIVSSLQEYISGQDKELQNLQRDEQELTDLVDNLGNGSSDPELAGELPAFETMKGKLKWPVNGKIITRFGSEKKEGKLKWNGVRIAAPAGTGVSAIGPGKVIFADWFRNLGLLVIIDHGNGFMSLYGHNETLAKKAGDLVSMGEQISSVGDTGGQGETALYFEIRREGTPLNPDQWCKD